MSLVPSTISGVTNITLTVSMWSKNEKQVQRVSKMLAEIALMIDGTEEYGEIDCDFKVTEREKCKPYTDEELERFMKE